MYASLKNYRHAPRKVRLVTDSLKGKTVASALGALRFMSKKAALPLTKLLRSAVANARQKGFDGGETGLIITSITVNKGTAFARYMPRARGSASRIIKQSSHVVVTLAENVAPTTSKETVSARKSEVSEEVTPTKDSANKSKVTDK